MNIRLLLVVGTLILAACQRQDGQTDPVSPDFNQIHWYASRAAIAYQSEADIRKAFPNTVLVATTPNSDVQYFLEEDPEHQRQIISIRGTDNLANIREDVEYVLSRHPKLGIYVHSGFDEDAMQIFKALQPHLDHSQTLILTGHSLGAAISTLLMMYLLEDGYSLGPSINFGQPKVTNHKGVEKYRSLPLLRVADENDVVPMVPPTDLIDAVHGAYEHLGPELVLLQGRYYTYQSHRQVEANHVDSFWDNLGDESVSEHYMKHYLQNINSKLHGASPVPYDERERYIQR